jgi:hypothetical protein
MRLLLWLLLVWLFNNNYRISATVRPSAYAMAFAVAARKLPVDPTTGTRQQTIAVVGGGLAGLSTVFYLLDKCSSSSSSDSNSKYTPSRPLNITILDQADVGTMGASAVAGGYVSWKEERPTWSAASMIIQQYLLLLSELTNSKARDDKYFSPRSLRQQKTSPLMYSMIVCFWFLTLSLCTLYMLYQSFASIITAWQVGSLGLGRIRSFIAFNQTSPAGQ